MSTASCYILIQINSWSPSALGACVRAAASGLTRDKPTITSQYNSIDDAAELPTKTDETQTKPHKNRTKSIHRTDAGYNINVTKQLVHTLSRNN